MLRNGYTFMDKLWQKIETMMMVFILTAMTLVTFVYTMLNNLYMPFYTMADWLTQDEPSQFARVCLSIGDYMMDLASSLSWSNEFTKACFAWLIFFCMSYGVRIGGHIGVDALIKVFHTKIQRIFAYLGLGACLLYGGIMLMASIEWVMNFYRLGTLAEGLDRFGVQRWQITVIVPLGFLLLIFRYLEIGYRLLMHKQHTLGLADEVADVLEDLQTRQEEERSQ